MEFLNLQIEERTKIFINNALLTNRGFNYYVDWTNVNGYNEFMVEIHAMDILIGCKDDNDFKDKFITLISLKSATKPFNLLLACTCPLVTEFADN